MIRKTFLVEIGTEELPSKTLRGIAESFALNTAIELENSRILYGNVQWFATPRRLALKVMNLASYQSDRKIEKRGPAIFQAFDHKGKPRKEAECWAYRCGITLDQAEYLITNKGKWLLYRSFLKGERVENLLPKIIVTALKRISTLKKMRWGTDNARFIRPIHTVTLLLDDQLIPAKVFGINSDRIIRGHRFMGKSELIINDANQYPKILLEQGKVIADYEKRKTKIKSDVKDMASKIGGCADLSDNLLEEVTSLVEWPVILKAKFEKRFLTIPTEALVHTMKINQKCFPIYDLKGKLLSEFILVANIEPIDQHKIVSGNEKVVRARFSDAEFFFNIDRKKCLEDYLPRLKTVLFHEELGTLHDKTERIQKLSSWIAFKIGANISYASRAGLLSKCDLMTDMVFEFSDIQGIIGMYYAQYDGESEDVAIALKEHYQPKFSGDVLPSNLVSCAVSIADKIDTIVGVFGIGNPPNGDKDPFALRRFAIGILRIIIEKKLSLDLKILILEVVRLYNGKLIVNSDIIVDNVIDFMLNRLCSWYRKSGYSLDIIQSIVAIRPTCPLDFDARIKAVSCFRKLKVARSLSVVNKRISNILAKSEEKLNETVLFSMLKEKEEIELAKKLIQLRSKLQPYFIEGRYQDALIEISNLGDLVDRFFEKVTINDDNKNMRINRLTLLSKVRAIFLKIADISCLQ